MKNMSETLNCRKNISIKQTLNTLYSDKNETGDAEFQVESEIVRAHRCVLAATSPKYKAQFYGLQAEEGRILLSDVSVSAFEEFLQFFYLEEVTLTKDNIETVLDLTKQSLNEDFFNECVAFLCEVVTADNACWAYRLAILYDITSLENVCKEHITWFPKKSFDSDDFLECDREVLIRILKMDTLNCKETEVFDACIAWAEAACKRKNIDIENKENLRLELDEAISEIRFCSMTSEEFAALHNLHKGFFTSDESIEIVYIIGKVKDFESEKFNQKPRNYLSTITPLRSYNSYLTQSSLKCDRILRKADVPRSLKTLFQSITLTFICDKKIRLESLVLGIDSRDCKVPSTVEIRHAFFSRRKTANVIKISDEELLISFIEPVIIEPSKFSPNILQFNLEGLKNCKSIFDLKTEVNVDDIYFKFDNEDVFVKYLLFNRA